MIKIFDLVNDKVVLNENVLLIPELKVVSDKYEGLEVFSYIHYMTHDESPYNNLDNDERSDYVFNDYKGDYHPDDLEVVLAMEKLEELYSTPVKRFYKAQRAMMDKIAVYLENVQIDDDPRQGNTASVARFVEKADKILQNYLKSQQAREEELVKSIGNRKIAYDQK